MSSNPNESQIDTAEAAVWDGADRRRSWDRRVGPTRMLTRYTMFGGKRESGGRRAGEADNCFVDRFGQGVFFLASMILLLNALDAFFTMLFLGHGGEEVNPVALFMLNISPWVFLVAKTVGIGLCTGYLVLVKNFKGVNLGIAIVLAVYVLLLAWHLYLYSHVLG